MFINKIKLKLKHRIELINNFDSLALYRNIVKTFIILNIYFLWLESVIPRLTHVFTFNRLFFVCVLASFSVYIFISKLKHKNKFSINVNKPNTVLFTVLSIYIFLDLLGTLYSPIPRESLSRYFTILPMITLITICYFIFNTKKDINSIFLSIGVSALTVCIISLYFYFFGQGFIFSRNYTISMVRDYNVFATYIIMGIALLIVNISRIDKSKFFKITFIALISSISITTVILSGSRRGVLLLGLIIFVIILYFGKSFLKKSRFNKYKKRIYVYFILALCIVLLSFLVFNLFNSFNASNNFISKRYKTILSEMLFSTRVVRWQFSIDKFLQYNWAEKLIGRGSEYDKQLFYTEFGANKLGSDYPHNMFLTDILNGGIIKVSVLMVLCIIIIKELLNISKRSEKSFFLMLLIAWIVIGFNNFISSGGILTYKPFWIFLFLTAACTRLDNDE